MNYEPNRQAQRDEYCGYQQQNDSGYEGQQHQSFEQQQRSMPYSEETSYSHSDSRDRERAVRPVHSGDGSIFGAVLCYVFGWLSGLLFMLFSGRNRFIRFHALQSLLFFGGINVLDIALISIGFQNWFHIHYLFGLWLLIFLLINLIAFIGWIVGMVQAASGNYYRMPVIGEVAAGFMRENGSVKP
jgi:uncharacterized membrane protein